MKEILWNFSTHNYHIMKSLIDVNLKIKLTFFSKISNFCPRIFFSGTEKSLKFHKKSLG